MAQKKKDKMMEVIITGKKEIKSIVCKTPKQAYQIFKDIINYEDYDLKRQEHFWVMGINAHGYVVCLYIAAIGSENRIIVDASDVFGMAIAKDSKEVVLAHNHPHAIHAPGPSVQDFDVTNRFYHACLPFGIRIIDHIIIAEDDYYSFQENGDMEILMGLKKYKTYDAIKPNLDEEKKKHGEHQKEVGKYEGREERTIEIAKNLLKNNVTIKVIMQSTALDKDSIQSIKQSLDKEF